MTITLNLAPEDEAQLNGVAARQGQDADQAAYSIFRAGLAQAVGTNGETAATQTRPVWRAEFRAKYNIPADREPLSDEELRALDPEDEAEAISIGLDAMFAGRMTAAAEWKERFRARHNIPADLKVEPMSDEEARLLP